MKKRSILAVSILTLLIIILCVTVACDKGGEEGKEVLVVFYPNNGGTPVSVITDGTLHSDVCPDFTYEGYEFAGWCSDIEGTTPISFPYTVNDGDMIFASWIQRAGSAHTVTFVTNGGSAVGNQTTALVQQAPSTTKEGYQLTGWCLDEQLSQQVIFPYSPEKDVTLYAKFKLSGVAYDTDEQANSLVFKWPAQEGATYEVKVTNYPSVEVFVSNDVASFSLPIRDDVPFTVEIIKHTSTGPNEMFRRNFERFASISLDGVDIRQAGEDVKFVVPENTGSYQISVADVSSGCETLYTLFEREFTLPASYFSKEKVISFRNVKDDPQKTYFSFRSAKMSISRLSAPEFGRYRDVEHNMSWSSVSADTKYDLYFYLGDEVIRVDENVLPQSVSQGSCYYSFDPSLLFPNKDYVEFGVTVRAKGSVNANKIVLPSEESQKATISFIGSTEISLLEDKISWTKVNNASSYYVLFTHNGIAEEKKAERSESITLSSGGKYEITVRPNVSGLNAYTVSAFAKYELLDLPNVSFEVTDNDRFLIAWDPVNNASSFTLYITHRTTQTVLQSLSVDPLKRNAQFKFSDISEGVCDVSVVAIGNGVTYYNSPASYITINRLAKPEVTVQNEGTQIKVRINVTDKSAKYVVNHTSVQGYDNENEEGTSIKEIVLEQKNFTTEDVTFDLRVRSEPIATSTIEKKVTHDLNEAPLYYINSDEIVHSIQLLCVPSNFELKSEDRMAWRSDGAIANFEIKLDDKRSEGYTLPINSTSVEIKDVLAFYGLDALAAGNHSLYLRRTLPSDAALSSEYVRLDIKKLAAPSELSFKEKTLRWAALTDFDGLSEYRVVWNSTPEVGSTYNSAVNNYCSIEMAAEMIEMTKMYFGVIAIGKLDKNVLSSDVSEYFVINRLARPSLSVEDGILTWDATENGTYELYDGNVLKQTLKTNSYDVKKTDVGLHDFSVKNVSNDESVFSSERSEMFRVTLLETPKIIKVEDTENGYRFGIGIDLSTADGASVRYRLDASELDEPAFIDVRDISAYLFYPEKNGALTAGQKYTVRLTAIGDGVHTITSPVSNELEYYKLATPTASMNYAKGMIDITLGDVLDKYVVDEYVGAYNGSTFVNDDRTSESFLRYAIDNAKEGSSIFEVKAVSYGNVSSDAKQIEVKRLFEPKIEQSATGLNVVERANGERYAYSLKGSSEISFDGELKFADLTLTSGANEFSFIKRADGYLDSPVKKYTVNKLETPEASIDYATEMVTWTSVEGAQAYVYTAKDPTTLKNVTRSTIGNGASLTYPEGESVFSVYAKATGYVDSDEFTFKITKLETPSVVRNGLYFTWNEVLGANGYTVDVNGTSVDIEDNYYEIALDDLQNVVNSFSVRANGSEKVSSSAKTIVFERLVAPENLRADGDNVVWDEVDGALGYVVYADGVKVYEGSERSYEFGAAKVVSVAAYSDIRGFFATISLND